MIFCKIGFSTFEDYITGVKYMRMPMIKLKPLFRSGETTLMTDATRPIPAPRKKSGNAMTGKRIIFQSGATPKASSTMIFIIKVS